MEEKEEQVAMHFRVPKPVKEMVQSYAKKNHITVSYTLRMLVEKYIISPELETEAELWKSLKAFITEFTVWKDELNKHMQKIRETIKELEETLKELKETQISTLEHILGKISEEKMRKPARKCFNEKESRA